MTRNEVQQALGYLVAAFPRHDLNDATVEVYAEALAKFDAVHAGKAVRRLVATEQWFPPVARIIEEVRAVKREDEPVVKALAQPAMPGGEHLTAARELLAKWKGVEHVHKWPDPCPVCGGVADKPRPKRQSARDDLKRPPRERKVRKQAPWNEAS